MSYRNSILFISMLLLASLGSSLQAQDARLAREYYSTGEYEKASIIYKQLHERDRGNDYYYERYFATLLEIQDYKEAEKVVKKALKLYPDKVERYVDYGTLYERQEQGDKADEQYEKAVKNLPNNQVQIVKLANAFMTKKKYDFAIATYERGGKLLKEKHIFAFELGTVYREKGETANMIESYLNALDYLPNRMTNVQSFFQNYLKGEGDMEELKRQLYARLQKEPNSNIHSEMLIWLFMQEGDYANALKHAKALDRRLQEKGARVHRLGQTAVKEKSYEAAIAAFDYIVEEKGISCPFYVDAKQRLLAAKRERLAEGFAYTQADLNTLRQEYLDFLDEFGRSQSTSGIMRELAAFEARYMHNIDASIQMLEEVVKIPNLPRLSRAEAKIDLGDYYLMKGEIWEATLLYSQVDKELMDAPLGELARLRNAKLSYYRGDFEWAQEQLDVLKASTSELTANDAIELNVFIMEHLNLDTSARALELYAQADLLLFQNRFDEAFRSFDSIVKLFPDHGLLDDVYYQKALVHEQKQQYEQAAPYYQKIVENYKDGVLHDNALFRLAELYERKLNRKEEAMELYGKIIVEYKGSNLINEARRRFRKLRGDGV